MQKYLKHRVFCIFLKGWTKVNHDPCRELGSQNRNGLCSVPRNESSEWLLTQGWISFWMALGPSKTLSGVGWGKAGIDSHGSLEPLGLNLSLAASHWWCLQVSPLDSVFSARNIEKNSSFVGLFRRILCGLSGYKQGLLRTSAPWEAILLGVAASPCSQVGFLLQQLSWYMCQEL